MDPMVHTADPPPVLHVPDSKHDVACVGKGWLHMVKLFGYRYDKHDVACVGMGCMCVIKLVVLTVVPFSKLNTADLPWSLSFK